ncbi:MAG: glycerol-3-phosphate 1-O-acyltransferase PlsY [Acetivibrio sp.]
MIGQILLCLLIGYLCGSVSFGYIVGKFYKQDLRQHGSGNPGATNALRTLGVKGGLLTFAGDALKVIIPFLIIRFVFSNIQPCWEVYALYLGLGAVVGHNYPLWLKFKGGKGIVVTSGVILSFADWRVTLIGLILFILIVALTRYVSLGSLMVAWILPVNTLIFYGGHANFLHILGISLMFTAFAYVRHISNIKRLLLGTERKIGVKDE